MPTVRPDPPRRFDNAVPVEQLLPHPQNARRGNTTVIGKSISANGFANVVVVQAGTNMIISGEHRWRAAQQQGRTELPVLFLEIDDDWAMDLRLADNATSDAAAYDDELLRLVLTAVNDQGRLENTTYSSDELNLMAGVVAQQAAEAASQPQPGTQYLPPPATLRPDYVPPVPSLPTGAGLPTAPPASPAPLNTGFTPTLAPNLPPLENNPVTQAQIERTDTQLQNAMPPTRPVRSVMCPHCGESFNIDVN